jgi:hypothetical protein
MERDDSVPMVRIEQPERVYDREKILGRDAASVFPSTAQEEADKVVSATQAIVGSMSFVTETELMEIKAKRGGALRPEDGTMEADKTLWAVLQEAKDAKQEAFEEGWKTMKQGVYKPLDDEEAEFIDEVETRKRLEERRKEEKEKSEMDAFKAAREAQVLRRAKPPPAAVGVKRAGVELSGGLGAPGASKKPKAPGGVVVVKAKPKLCVVAKGKPKPKPAEAAAAATEAEKDGGRDADADAGGALGGLLAGYGSASDS